METLLIFISIIVAGAFTTGATVLLGLAIQYLLNQKETK